MALFIYYILQFLFKYCTSDKTRQLLLLNITIFNYALFYIWPL